MVRDAKINVYDDTVCGSDKSMPFYKVPWTAGAEP